ncbi:threonine--tRNA ligase [Candidatus Uhrbacteria bacterium]|nr:threonine--tRNA ligase [Candidatus Uhrbacteria bacterium]
MQEQKSFSLETMRHSSAHLLATAIQALYPDAKFGVGPVVEHGFYYDMELDHSISEENFKEIEKKMDELKKKNIPFTREEISLQEAKKLFTGLGQTYKVQLLEDIEKYGTTKVGEQEEGIIQDGKNIISIYRTGDFVDLCRGPHVASTRDVGSIKLKSVAGAYWRGDEKNPMLQRVYGYAFATKDELAAHLKMIEEAEKRDHRKLGKELDLFVFSELVGSGLPLWTPRGTLLRTILDEFVWELRKKNGYEKVTIPHITKKDLYVTSGHWEKFADDLFHVTTREEHEFALKPMNCPHHTQIFARTQQSYRNMPQRYAETTMVYRDEQSGELAGLSRVLCITQDDAHVFCRENQLKEEILIIWNIINVFYATFGFSDLRVRLSLHDPEHFEKYLGTPEMWKKTEDQLRELVKERGVHAQEAVGEAAMYGPKIDFLAYDSLGREWQVATIQLDRNQPERFDLFCINEQGERERIVMIHAAITGSLERFLSVIIEHFAGAFPLWLAPVQVCIAPVGLSHVESSQKLANMLEEEGVRVEVDDSNESVGYKIRKAEKAKIPYMIVIGDKEADLENVSVRIRGKKDVISLSLNEYIEQLKKKIRERSLEL